MVWGLGLPVLEYRVVPCNTASHPVTSVSDSSRVRGKWLTLAHAQVTGAAAPGPDSSSHQRNRRVRHLAAIRQAGLGPGGGQAVSSIPITALGPGMTATHSFPSLGHRQQPAPKGG